MHFKKRTKGVKSLETNALPTPEKRGIYEGRETLLVPLQTGDDPLVVFSDSLRKRNDKPEVCVVQTLQARRFSTREISVLTRLLTIQPTELYSDASFAKMAETLVRDGLGSRLTLKRKVLKMRSEFYLES